MKALIVQKNTNNTDYLSILRKVNGMSPDIVCFGELCTTGCLYQPRPFDSLDKIRQNLAEFKFAVMMGCPVKINGSLFNSYIFHLDGKHEIYYKINLFEPMNETSVYRPGHKPGLFRTRLGNFGIAICYDLRFPELFENLVALGAEKIFVPAAFPRVRIEAWNELLIKRARDFKITIIAINCVGDDGTNEFGGNSMIIDSGGKIMARADETSETILEVEL